MGEAIEKHGGHIDKFLGDGILAYFGRQGDPRDACRQALEACVEMAKNLQEGNAQLATVLDEPLSLGLGLHFGSVILGEMGFGANKAVTIIGDTVNTASRLEHLNKAAQSQLVLSTAAGARAGLDLSFLPMAHAAVRGKTEKLRVYVVKDILKELAPLVAPR
jgi:adenylate cyclase